MSRAQPDAVRSACAHASAPIVAASATSSRAQGSAVRSILIAGPFDAEGHMMEGVREQATIFLISGELWEDIGAEHLSSRPGIIAGLRALTSEPATVVAGSNGCSVAAGVLSEPRRSWNVQRRTGCR